MLYFSATATTQSCCRSQVWSAGPAPFASGQHATALVSNTGSAGSPAHVPPPARGQPRFPPAPPALKWLPPALTPWHPAARPAGANGGGHWMVHSQSTVLSAAMPLPGRILQSAAAVVTIWPVRPQHDGQPRWCMLATSGTTKQNRLIRSLVSDKLRWKQHLFSRCRRPGGAVRADALEPLRHLAVNALLRLYSQCKGRLWLASDSRNAVRAACDEQYAVYQTHGAAQKPSRRQGCHRSTTI